MESKYLAENGVGSIYGRKLFMIIALNTLTYIANRPISPSLRMTNFRLKALHLTLIADHNRVTFELKLALSDRNQGRSGRG